MTQPCIFDLEFRLRELETCGDPLVQLNRLIDWELFRPTLNKVREKPRKSNAGRRPLDVVVMFKVLVLQSLYNLSDDMVEYQIRDRLSFMRFLNLELHDGAPDAKTIWLFRDELTERELVKPLFERFDAFLREAGFAARKGQIVDAGIVCAPRQRNTREENRRIENGETPAEWSEPKRRQKDTDARWVMRQGGSYYGYKNHLSIDVKHKFIRDYEVTDAATHDSWILTPLHDPANSSRDVWADSAYRCEENLEFLEQEGYREHLQRKGCRHRPLSEREKKGNRTRSRTRARVEHIFGVQAQRAGDLLLRSIGIARARAKIGLRNLNFNLDHYARLAVG